MNHGHLPGGPIWRFTMQISHDGGHSKRQHRQQQAFSSTPPPTAETAIRYSRHTLKTTSRVALQHGLCDSYSFRVPAILNIFLGCQLRNEEHHITIIQPNPRIYLQSYCLDHAFDI